MAVGRRKGGRGKQNLPSPAPPPPHTHTHKCTSASPAGKVRGGHTHDESIEVRRRGAEECVQCASVVKARWQAAWHEPQTPADLPPQNHAHTSPPFTLRVLASRMPMRAVSASEVAAPIWCPTEASTLCSATWGGGQRGMRG